MAEVKANSVIEHSDDDTLLAGLIQAAREYAENFTGQALVSQTWEARFDDWQGGRLGLRPAPLLSVDWVKYVDTDGVLQTLATDQYVSDSVTLPGRIYPAYNVTWPSIRCEPHAVRVQYVAGYSAIPQVFKQAILLLVGHWYENREAVAPGALNKIPMGAESLLWTKRLLV